MKILFYLILLYNLSFSHPSYKYLNLIGSFPDENSQIKDAYLSSPFKIEKFDNTYIVSDAETGCLKVFNENGQLVRVIGRKGQGPGEIGKSYVFTVNKQNGDIYSFDSDNHRISIFKVDGSFKKSIRTTLSVWDMIFVKGYLFMSAYSETNKTLFVKMDSEGNIIKFFGNLIDPRVNKIPWRYQTIIYGAFSFFTDGNLIFAINWYLPYIFMFDVNENIQKVIKVQIAEALFVYEKNLNAYKKRQGARLGISYWTKGASILDGNIFCYCLPKKDRLLILNKDGQLKDELLFSDPREKETIKIYWGFIDKYHFFIDNGFIKYFEESTLNEQ